MIKAQATLGFKEDDQNFKEKLDVFKEEKKDSRQQIQAEQQMAMKQAEEGLEKESPQMN